MGDQDGAVINARQNIISNEQTGHFGATSRPINSYQDQFNKNVETGLMDEPDILPCTKST